MKEESPFGMMLSRLLKVRKGEKGEKEEEDVEVFGVTKRGKEDGDLEASEYF